MANANATQTATVIKGKAGRYEFQPYDVLQIRQAEWTDFSTLRTETEARQAVAIVDSGRFMDTVAKFRIVRNNPTLGNVVYGELQLVKPAKLTRWPLTPFHRSMNGSESPRGL